MRPRIEEGWIEEVAPERNKSGAYPEHTTWLLRFVEQPERWETLKPSELSSLTPVWLARYWKRHRLRKRYRRRQRYIRRLLRRTDSLERKAEGRFKDD